MYINNIINISLLFILLLLLLFTRLKKIKIVKPNVFRCLPSSGLLQVYKILREMNSPFSTQEYTGIVHFLLFFS